jgi:flagellar hook assembly protein FlgD
MGRQVKALIDRSQTAGYKSIQWDATNDNNQPVSAGLYLYTIQAGDYSQTKKMVLLK